MEGTQETAIEMQRCSGHTMGVGAGGGSGPSRGTRGEVCVAQCCQHEGTVRKRPVRSTVVEWAQSRPCHASRRPEPVYRSVPGAVNRQKCLRVPYRITTYGIGGGQRVEQALVAGRARVGTVALGGRAGVVRYKPRMSKPVVRVVTARVADVPLPVERHWEHGRFVRCVRAEECPVQCEYARAEIE